MKASVLMSVFNETEEEIHASVLSILEQSFDDYEIIIVHDNPASDNKKHMVDWLKGIDSRIIVVENDENIGLAMSMNKAFDLARGEYIIRMDSDDICEPGRFKREIDLLETHEWDLIFTNYSTIDSDGNSIQDGKRVIEKRENEESLISEIIFDGIIHHPTVAMTRDIFIKAKGYRNFPCSQDLDLWLRMIECGCRFLYLNEPLLKYRIRENSITGSNRLKQHLTITYIIHLFTKRLENGYDDFSATGYEQFIRSRMTDQTKKQFQEAIYSLMEAQNTENGIKRIILRIKALCICPALAHSYIYKKTHKKRLLKKIKLKTKCTVSII